MYTLEGVTSVANFITAYEESKKNRDSYFQSEMCSLFPKTILLTCILRIHAFYLDTRIVHLKIISEPDLTKSSTYRERYERYISHVSNM